MCSLSGTSGTGFFYKFPLPYVKKTWSNKGCPQTSVSYFFVHSYCPLRFHLEKKILTPVTIYFSLLLTRGAFLFIWQNTSFKRTRFHFNFLPLFFLLTKQPLPVFTARDTERCSITGAHFYLASSRDLYRELIHWLGCSETVSRGLTQGYTPSNTISTLCSPILFTLESFNLHVLYPALLISNRK